METVTTPATDAQSGKTFTPEQVENIVKERLARDREARKDENAEKIAEAERQATEAKAELQAASQTIETLKGTSATAEEITTKVKASWSKIEASLPADKKKFVPAKYSEAEKIEYIADNPELFFPTVTPPNTPPPVNNQNGDGGEPKFKGYATQEEFAQREPTLFLKWKREGKI